MTLPTLTALRQRVYVVPTPARPLPEGKPARLVQIVHVLADPDGFLIDAALVELQDNVVTEVLVAPGDGTDLGDLSPVRGAPGSVVVPERVTLDQLCRRLERRGGQAGATTVGVDLPWTLGLLAADVRRLRRRRGMSIALRGGGWPHHQTDAWMDSHYRRRVALASGGGGRVFIRWQPPARRRPGSRRKHRRGGPFLDLAVLGAALGVDWPSRGNLGDRLVRQGLALADTYGRLVAELDEVAPGLAPQDAWSWGSVPTYALRRAGMADPALSLATLPDDVLGAVAAATFGPEATARLVGVARRMALFDMNRTFPALFDLLRLTPHLVPDHFEHQEVDSAELVALFESPDPRTRLEDSEVWRRLATTFVLVEPHGEPLPCHRQAGPRWRTVTTSLELHGGRYWVHALDLVEPSLAGRVPRLHRAFAVDPVGMAPGLCPVRLPSGATVDLAAGSWGAAWITERDHGEAIADSALRRCRVAFVKGAAVSACWGALGRSDRLSAPRLVQVTTTDAEGKERIRWVQPRTETVTATGPDGRRFTVETDRPEIPGPVTLPHLAAAIPAACRAIMALARHDLGAIGCQFVAEMTDALAFTTDDVDPVAVRRVLGRFDHLLYPDGSRSAWKEEVQSLTLPTWGLCLGVNKLLLGREVDGRIRLVRSTDTGLGDHYWDPSGTGDLLDDGRTAWARDLLEPVFELALRTGEVRVPPADALPAWATDRPALRPRRAAAFDDLMALRERTMQPVPPFADFLSPGLGERDPVMLGLDHDPAEWREFDWDFGTTAVYLAGEEIDFDTEDRLGRRVVANTRTYRDLLRRWITDSDPTMSPTADGVRRPVPVYSHPSLVQLVGRAGTGWEIDMDDALVYGTGDIADLLHAAAELGSGALVAAGVSRRTAERITARRTRPRAPTTRRLAAALAAAGDRMCAGPGCQERIRGRHDRRFHSDACRKAARRAATTTIEPEIVTVVEGSTICPACGAVLLGAARNDVCCPVCGHLRERS
ncbi:MAG: hypothetical protein ACYCU7_03225 [Acidimicrobiales bacterium]